MSEGRKVRIIDDFAEKAAPKEERFDNVQEFYDKYPLDSVVRTESGKVAYGFISDEIAKAIGTPEAPVIVTEELYNHLDAKEEDRESLFKRQGFNGLREVVEYGFENPLTISGGNGDGSININFKGKTGKDMYMNLMFVESPVPAYIVRSVVPAKKNKDIVFAENQVPSMNVPDDIDRDLETAISKVDGDRVTGKTWNKENLLKSIRLHAQEGKYPTTAELDALQGLLAKGNIEWMQTNFKTYIKQALEQPNTEMFFDIAKKTGVLAKIDPELNAIVNDEFLTAMKKANSLSTTAKSAVLVDTIAAKSEQDVSAVATKYGLAVADEIKALREYGKRFAKVGSEDIEMLWPMVEAMTDKFNPKKEAVIDTVSELVAFKYPELAGQGDFNKKKENCHNIYSWGPTAVKVAKRLKGDIIKSGVPYTEADAMANDKAKSQIIEKVKTKGKRLTFVAFDTKDEHILRHMEGDFNPGSQFTLEDKGRNELFKSANNVLEDLLDEHGNPGRRVLAIKADKEIGTCGVMPIEYFDSSKVMTISRDVGNPSRHKGMGDQVHVVIIPDEDVVKTNTAYFIAGPYGNSGLYGPYTAFLAPYAPPFPNYDIDPKLAQDVKERIKKSNEENADAWSKLVMPMTETQAEGYLQTIQKEAEARHAKGDEANAKLLDVMSRTFENGLNAYRTNGKKSPVLDREKFAKYRPEIPSDALVVEVSIAPGGKQGNIKGKESGGR